MKKEMLDELIGEFLSSDISANKKGELKNKIIRAGYNPDKLEKMDNLYSKFDKIDIPQTSNKLDVDFYQSLKNYKNTFKNKTPYSEVFIGQIKSIFQKKYALLFAYSIALVIIGWFLGNLTNQNHLNNSKIQSMSREINHMKQVVMYTMLEQSSATSRIKAINISDDLENIDNKILNALLNTLNSDPNSNVRLTAVEALAKYSNIQLVRRGLISSISLQESPLVQIALVDLMLKLKEKSSIRELKLLLEQKSLNYSVRNKIHKTIKLL